MKLIYSHLQKFLPTLDVEPQKLRDDITMIGHFVNFYEEIEGEIIFDLDIKVNRGDCLGYYGLARDLSVYYNIKLVSPFPQREMPEGQRDLPIKVLTDNVKRVMAVKLSGLKNQESPDWLQKFIRFHGNKPINLIVDLSNYIMFMYGIPNHAFDTKKSSEELVWEMNPKYKEFISLDVTSLKLSKNILMINNPEKALSLSFWGGEACAIENDSADIIVEMAVYNPAVVRQNSRELKSVTEASIRLEKQLDPELIPLAFNQLINLILENCGGQISSAIFDYYSQQIELPQIKFNCQSPSKISGIDIAANFSVDCLTRLGCQLSTIDDLKSIISVTPPSIRSDITLPADLDEEVVRFYGYQEIPANQPLSFKEVSDITPKINYLIDELKDKLVGLGYDEILSWPLVSEPLDPKTVIATQNSINSESIYLRQSLIPSLKEQLDQYQRLKLNATQFFEIGKVFSCINNQFVEKFSLGIYNSNSDQLNSDLDELNLKAQISDSNFAEIILDNLPKPSTYSPKVIDYDAYELTSQLITLDANVNFDAQQDSFELIKKYSQIIGRKYLWQLVIADNYQDQKTQQFKYTFRATYFNTDDKTAKSIHLKSFNLEKI
jgi:phenylalanyl-tRNA synthetase beta chain